MSSKNPSYLKIIKTLKVSRFKKVINYLEKKEISNDDRRMQSISIKKTIQKYLINYLIFNLNLNITFLIIN